MKTTKTEATRKPLKLSGNMVTIPIGPDGKCPDPIESELVRALKAFAALDISDCPHCQGSGFQYPGLHLRDACHTCGGTGEVVSQVLPEDVRQARAALQLVKGGE